jgi:transposase-like protein
MIRIHLTDEQRREIERVSQQAVGRVALRAHMVLLAGRGYRVPQIARIHDCGEDVVRHWLHRYQDQGVAGLEDAPRRTRPLSVRPLTDAERAVLQDSLRAPGPPAAAHGHPAPGHWLPDGRLHGPQAGAARPDRRHPGRAGVTPRWAIRAAGATCRSRPRRTG